MIVERKLSFGHLLLWFFSFLAALLLLSRRAEGTMSVGFNPPLRQTPGHSRGRILPWASYRPPERALLGPSWMSLKSSMDVKGGDSSSGSAMAVEPPQQMANYIRTLGLEASFFKAGGGGTAQEAAEILGTESSNVIKSLLFLAGGRPVLVLAPGDSRVNTERLRKVLGLDRRVRARLAPVSEAERQSGYTVGSIPPFNWLHPVSTVVVDSRVRDISSAYIFCGSGQHGVEMRMQPRELVDKALSGAIVDDVSSACETNPEDAASPSPRAEQPLVMAVSHGPGGGKFGGTEGWVESLPVLIVSRSHIGKRLLFASVVPCYPSSHPDLAADGQNCLIRNVWQWGGDPVAGCPPAPFNLQVVIGKTLLTLQGPDACDKAIGKARVGRRALVTGMLKPNPREGQGMPVDLIVHEIDYLADPVSKPSSRARENVTYLKGLPIEDVMLVDTVEKVASVKCFLGVGDAQGGGAKTLGIDCEWRPKQLQKEVGGDGRVATLQVSTGRRSAVFDFVALLGVGGGPCSVDAGAVLDKTLGELFSETGPENLLGFGFGTDVGMLREGFPELTSLEMLESRVEARSGFYEMSAVCSAFLSLEGQRSHYPLGLSRACKQILGSPVDKDQQASDWESRPLSPAQLAYASTDAMCLVLLFNATGGSCGEAAKQATAAAAAPQGEDLAAKGRRAGKVKERKTGRGSARQEQASQRQFSSLEGGGGGDDENWAAEQSTWRVENLYERALLGCAMPGGGKGAVLKCIGGYGRMGVGTVEWGGGGLDGGGGLLALFVNVQGSRYMNEFLNEGREITWFGTRGQCSRGALRLILDSFNEGKGGRVESVQVLLFCRYKGQPYVFLGDLELINVETGKNPAKLTWRLTEYEELKESLHFHNVIATATRPLRTEKIE